MRLRTERAHELRVRRHRREKIRKLKAKLAAANSKSEREKIIEKIRRVHPFYPL